VRISRLFIVIAVVVAGMLSFAADKKELSEAVASVEANLKTPEGKKYDEHMTADFQKYAPQVRQCKQTESGTPASFDMLLRLEGDGKIVQVLVHPETPMAKCSRTALMGGKFTPPPHANYWVNIHLDFKH
jgi:hypothetical protein